MEALERYDDLINSLVISRLQNKRKFMGMVEIGNRRADQMEKTIWDLMNDSLDNCQGKQLDVAGEIAGISRGNWDDESFRTLIKLQIIINIGSGEPEVLIQAVKGIYRAKNVDYTPVYPAKVRIWEDGEFGVFLVHEMGSVSGDDLCFLDGSTFTGRSVDEESRSVLQGLLPSGVDLLSGYSVTDMEGNEMGFLDGSDVIGVIYE